ncbi:hypothetical protein COU62_02175 [Candidatus Pacearchaeota archaeon CG10_big_fil_rev_8_21_14_0_10_35_219]|nr:hypothetical protein [Candidatus Pacearchaeota archaeon]OIO41951.1 MAG: hypothetical protein AUJ63_04320 [Candidatus Pacearchaeota archaeon CG1_02_35_32]PIO07776.1 MAG: hypothetical protein COU62_02175 [Candidatus Pacearchaeota archaeon CG10_big_fil_rev_8_21_14_0_10_35_219]PIY80998.1 MAG: hypothetical protein COY79_04285 [Candidatus Pacearchaeota archaeon CG_4_10_14_0_8_um_filter_35_169]PJA70296.1 MAG: hypothetical protein CO155_01495 [Candidatus Pacearchaeota archaeon CG_4_9_14_3_um_filter_
MNEVIPTTLEFLGTFLIGIAVLRVHIKLGKEHKIDKKVLKAIRREEILTLIGLILITISFILHFF